jgi:hypothetical protein
MNADELHARIVQDAGALRALVPDDPTPPSDSWTVTPPLIEADADQPTPDEPDVLWLREVGNHIGLHGLGPGPHWDRISGLEGGTRRVTQDFLLDRIFVANPSGNALDEVAGERWQIEHCTFSGKHYGLFGGPFIDTRFHKCIFEQTKGRESTVRTYGGERLEFVGCTITKRPGVEYTKSPIRFHAEPGNGEKVQVRLKNTAIHGGAAIHVGRMTQNLINGYDPNPCKSFEHIGGSFHFEGLYPHDLGGVWRFTGCKWILIQGVSVLGPDHTPFDMIHVHRLADGTHPNVEVIDTTFNGQPISTNNIRWI